MSKNDVVISGKKCLVRTNQCSSSTWRAIGYANGRFFEAEGASEASAVRAWREHVKGKHGSVSKLSLHHRSHAGRAAAPKAKDANSSP